MTTSSENLRVAAIRTQVREDYAELNQFIQGPLAGLDPNKLYQSPDGTEWTIMQNLAHIVEFMPYWADEAAKLVATPGQNFGRTMEHEGRVHAIREHGTDNLEELRARLPASYAHLQRVLGTLTDGDLTLTGRHSKFGERDLAWFIDEFITRHLANHVAQLKACLNTIE
ncbi:MAG: DinB family protein [Chloroflexota bacterium]|nr:DinB family protein [Chloroflexota bacterium]